MSKTVDEYEMDNHFLEITPETIRLLKLLPSFPEDITGLAMDEKRLYLAFQDRKVQIFSLDELKQVGEVGGTNLKFGCSQDVIFGQIPMVAIDDLYIFVMGDGAWIHAFDKRNFQEWAKIPINGGTKRSFTVDGSLLYAGDYDSDTNKHVINIYSRLGREKHEMDYRPDFYRSWYTFKHIATLEGHTEAAYIICNNRDKIFSWSTNEMIIWNKKNHRQVDIIEKKELKSNLALVQDGFIFTVPWERAKHIKVCNKENVKHVAYLKGHQENVWNLMVIGKYLISQSVIDGCIKGWSLAEDFKEFKIIMKESDLYSKIKEIINKVTKELD